MVCQGVMDHKKLLEEKLREAASIGDVDTVKELISMGVDVNSRNGVNGWTALHWAAARSKTDIVGILLRNGAEKGSLTYKGETPSDLSSSCEISNCLGDNNLPNAKKTLAIIPNYLRNPPFHYSVSESIEKGPVSQTTVNSENGLILKLVVREHPLEFVEIEMSKSELTLQKLKEVCSKDLLCLPGNIFRILKLPNTIIRNDRDVQRLTDFQEIKCELRPMEHEFEMFSSETKDIKETERDCGFIYRSSFMF